MDFKKLSSVDTTKQVEDSKKEVKKPIKRVVDSKEAEARKQRIADARRRILKRRAEQAKQKRQFGCLSDSRFKSFKKRIQDELEETETTEEAIDVATSFLEEAAPEDVIQATVEILGAAIDGLEGGGADEDLDDIDEGADEDLDDIEDSAKSKRRMQRRKSMKK